ncbi:GNAT family N-acetyltransferase [uncultured Roseobacter sp.]|uniref:GNAT family N-acetyltransferase n=1 Tax=uncultured Roseobacter sp. TaxID=114847 RepID=UPI002621CB49|nr:GNAT family N-acetyltransferase [uncultured Roseobacter sp.]
MTEITLKPINKADHAEDALDLAERAADYVTLEIGRAPDMDYINEFFEAVPPGLTTDNLYAFAVMQETAMLGMVCVAEGYELPTDWWIGLMLLDPAFRGRGTGRAVLHLLRKRARRAGATMLKLSVLEANPRAVTFWTREGFVPHRYAPATPESDGHNRWVLKHQL